jgi:hypothetical protein
VIPISAAEKFGIEQRLKQVIIFGWDGKETHVVTWGKSIKDCAQAAAGGNKIKSNWGWPEEMMAEPARVTELKKKVANLIRENERLGHQVDHLERELDRRVDNNERSW